MNLRFLDEHPPLKATVVVAVVLILIAFIYSALIALVGDSDLGLPFKLSFIMVFVLFGLYEFNSVWEVTKTRRYHRIPFELIGWGLGFILIFHNAPTIWEFLLQPLTHANLMSLDVNLKWVICAGLVLPVLGVYDEITWIVDKITKYLELRRR